MKHAQISVFILAGLLILVVAGVFVIMQKQYTIQQSPGQKAVQQYIQSCFEPAAYDAVYIAGLQGGYLEVTDSADNPIRQQYYYYYYEDISPNLTTIYDNIERYILNHTISCAESSGLPYTYTIDTSSANIVFSASESETTATLTLPITITEENQVSALNTFTATIPASLEKMYAIARQIVDSITESDPLLCISCLHDIAKSQNLFFSIIEYEELSDYYILTDSSMLLYNAPYVFTFMIRRSEDYDVSSYFKKETPLSLELPSYTATAGEEFSLNINTEEFLQNVVPQFIAQPEYSLAFADFTPLFDIEPLLGIITFTPAEQQKGIHNLLLKIEDNQGNTEYVTLELVIE